MPSKGWAGRGILRFLLAGSGLSRDISASSPEEKPAMGMLDGKRAIVTGASRGIGRAIALRLAQEGAAVFLAADGTEEELRDAAAECGAKAAWGVFDLERREGPEAMAAAAPKGPGGGGSPGDNPGGRAPP